MKPFFQFYKKFNSLLKDTWVFRVISTLFGVILVVLDSYLVLVLGTIVDKVALGEVALIDKLTEMIIVLAIPFVIEPITFSARNPIYLRSQYRLTKLIYEKVINQDYKYHIDKQTGKIITKILKAPELMFSLTWDVGYYLFDNILRFFVPLIFIWLISPKISILSFIVFLMTLPLIYWASVLNIKHRIRVKDEEYDRNSVIADGLNNFTSVRAFGKESREVDILTEKLDIYSKALLKYQVSWRLVDFVSRFSGIAVFSVASYFSWLLYSRGQLSLGSVIAIITYMMMYMGRVISFFFSLRNIVKDIPVMQDLLEMINSDREINDPENPKLLIESNGKVELKDIYFSYDKRVQVVEGISLTVEPNQTVGFVGPSGGGKTTLTKLIMRYYDPSKGEILIDGINIRDLRYENLRDLIGLVPQEPVLFNQSLYYNVAYAFKEDFMNKEKNFDKVVEACKKAQNTRFYRVIT